MIVYGLESKIEKNVDSFFDIITLCFFFDNQRI